MLPKPFQVGETKGLYLTSKPANEEEILAMANYLAKQRFRKGRKISSADDCASHLQSLYQMLEHELFGLIYLDQQHRIIQIHELFRGTINETSVHPREIVKTAIHNNAAAIIVFHNHPSGSATPSNADIDITKHIQKALELIDIRLLDHLIIGCEGFTSLSQAHLF